VQIAVYYSSRKGARQSSVSRHKKSLIPDNDRKGDTMATATQLALIKKVDTKMQSHASRQFADARRPSIAGQDEEAVLVLAAKNGDAQAFEILIKRSQRRILAVALRFTRIREDAEDVVQQSFQKAFVCLHKFEGKSSFSTWLTRIAINQALMSLRSSRAHREVSINDLGGNHGTEPVLEIPDSREGPESVFLRDERSRILFAALNKLKPGIRTAIELRELGELSTKEAARVMGLSVSAVKARAFHGRRKLHQILKRKSTQMYGKEMCGEKGYSECRR
jgi:RNA polymerase sigma-70 factor, ECF subfamily